MDSYLLSERPGVILNPELPIFFHVTKPFCNLTWKIPIFVSHFLSLPPLNPSTPLHLYLLVNELLRLGAMGKKNRLAPGR